MPLALIFWILMLLWFVLGIYLHWTPSPPQAQWLPWGGNLLLFILLVMLGWATFGPAIK
jgi:hypothetical protein